MQIYRLTPLGQRLAHNTRYVDTPEGRANWKVINHINKMKELTRDQFQEYTGLSRDELASALIRLKGAGVIVDETRAM